MSKQKMFHDREFINQDGTFELTGRSAAVTGVESLPDAELVRQSKFPMLYCEACGYLQKGFEHDVGGSCLHCGNAHYQQLYYGGFE